MKTKVLKKLCSCLLALAMLTSTSIGQSVGELVGTNLTVSAADTLTYGNYSYTVNDDNTVTITKYNGSGTDILLPPAIDGKKVTTIGNRAFGNSHYLKSITIPDSVTRIEYGAFRECQQLTDITIPDSITTIGDSAFYRCYNLESITIPNSITSIGDYTFSECTHLTNITLPNNLQSIGKWTFSLCKSLTEITIPNSVTSIGEYAFYECESLIKIALPDSMTSIGDNVFLKCTSLTNVTIPNSITSIGNSAFSICTSLKSINIPDSVTSIGGGAFGHCTSLTSITIPNSVTSIDGYAFKYCSGLKNITLPNTIKYIHASVFQNCTGLTAINLPNSVTAIKDSAFSGCTGLTSISLPEKMTEIGSYAFNHCDSLTNITIPSNVTEIGIGAFQGCKKLTNIGVDVNNAVYCSKNGVLFDKNKTMIIAFPCGKKGTYVIPDGVKEIFSRAFYQCDGLTSTAIPNSVTSIGELAFYYCTGLTSIKIPDNVTYIGDSAFDHCTGLTNVDIPNNVTRIGYRAYYYCTQLTSVTIPDSVTSIGDYAFSGCNNLTIYGNSDSYAATYAAENNIPFTAIEPTPEPKYISDITITLTPVSFTYDGTAKKPSVTVKDGTKTLVLNTDYSLKYEDNINAGTAKVTVTGKSNYNGSVTKKFTINPKSVANTAITLNPTSYIYDGTEKKPIVTVKDSKKTLVLGTDYSVSYSNNVNVGTAAVIITGKNNYTGTAKATFSITEPSLKFEWNADNWQFENSKDYINNVSYSEKINSTYLDVLKENLSYSEYMKIFGGEGRSPALLYTTNGSCYGMSAVALLAKYGFMNFENYQTNAEKLYDLDAPIKHSLNYLSNKNNVSSLITYYQLLQMKDVIQQKCRKVSNRSNKTNIQEILALLDKNAVVLVGYQWGTEKNSFAHAVLAYGYGYENNTFNGVTYDGYIKIYDPNCSYNDTGVYIYFRKSTYDWIIPGKQLSSSGYPSVKFSCIDADTNEINDGGYFDSNTNSNDSDGFIARIDAPVISNDRFVSKMTQSGGGYMTQSGGENDIIEDYSYILNGNSNGIFGYNLYDPDSAYEVSQKAADKLELHMDYENCDLYGYSSLGKSVVFDKKGFVSIEGKSGDYEMSMTFDRDYPTDWFYINVSGTGAGNVSLSKEKGGYVLSGDNLKKIQVYARNMDNSASIGFSTDYKKVFIYEIDKNTIGLKADKDNNGTYETNIKGIPILENNSHLSSDYIELGSFVTVTASGRGGVGSLQYAVLYKKQSETKWTVKQEFGKNTTVSIKPEKAVDYDICVKVKDSSGTVEKKYFTVKVCDVLKSTSTISAAQINLGSTVSVKASATGGAGNYTYAVYYKKKSDTKWTAKQDFSKNAAVSIKPQKAVDYDICVKVKDSSGTVEKKYFTVKVCDVLKSTSTISAAQINLGSTVSVKASATGGAGNYTYAVYYKKKSDTKWTAKQDFGKNTAVSIKPAKAVNYDICVKVKDSSGTVEKKYFAVKVCDVLKNTSTISAAQISLGSTVSVKASATGGAGNYTYAVYYKKKSDTKWTAKQDFGKNTAVSIKPAKAVNYDICVKVKDDSGTVEKKYFEITVK